MTTTRYVLLDLNHDGFCCMGQSGDALNIIPAALNWQLNEKRAYNATATVVGDQTLYGIRRYAVTCDTGLVTSGVSLGVDSGLATYSIPVSASTEYTAVIWARGSGDAVGGNFTLALNDEPGGTLGTQGFTMTADWQQVTVTATTGGTATHAYINVYNTANKATAWEFDVTGWMLVAGDTAPAAFNTGDADDLTENISDRVETLSWQYGLSALNEEVAQPSRMFMTLRNDAGDWWQDVASAAFYAQLRPGTRVKLVYDVDGTLYTRYQGQLIPPTRYDTYQYAQHRRFYLTAGDPMDTLNVQEYRPQLRANVRIDTEIERVLTSGIMPETYYEHQWVLGVTELGSNAVFPDYTGLLDLEEARTTLDHSGVDAGTEMGVSAGGYLQELVAAEMGGRLFYDAPTGKIVFHNRHHDILNSTPAVTFSNDDLLPQSEAEWGGNLANHVTLNYTLVEEGAAGGVLWEATNVPISVRAGETRQFRISYRDPSNEAIRVSALDVIRPEGGTDYTANSLRDGSGDNMLAQFTVTATPDATAALITLKNTSTTDGYITALQLRGTPLKTWDGLQVISGRPASIHANGFWPLMLNVPLINSEDHAQNYADWLSAQYQNAETRFSTVATHDQVNATMASAINTLNVGDRVTVEETWSGHDKDYFIIGAAYQDNGTRIDATYRLKPATAGTAWVLGVTELGSDAIMAF